MAETKCIGKVHVVTDSETSYDNMGDVDGGFSEDQLLNHIRAYGPQQLYEKLSYMQWQIIDAVRRIDAERFKDMPVGAGSGA